MPSHFSHNEFQDKIEAIWKITSSVSLSSVDLIKE